MVAAAALATLSSARRSTILLLQVESSLADRLGQCLRDEGFRVTALARASLEDCFDQLQRENPELLILSGDPAGLALCRLLRQSGVGLPLLLLIEDRVGDLATGLDAGADDFIIHPYLSERVLDCVRCQIKRLHSASDGLLRFGDLVMNTRTREVQRADQEIELTAKEFDLLRYLLDHPREVLTREQILLNVWGEDFMGESNIIEVYIRYLRMKIERENEKKLIQTVRGVGYTLRD